MQEESAGKPDRAGVAIALLLAILSGVILFDTSRLTLTSTYGVGPKMMPIVVAVGIGALALANLVIAIRADFPAREDMDARAVLLILGGLAALIALIALGGGFIVAIGVLFMATSAAFGPRAWLSDLAIGLALGLLTYLLFVKLLTLSLPMGPLERLL